jgi:ATP-dependent Clp protease ATP-binding subunit ClpA
MAQKEVATPVASHTTEIKRPEPKPTPPAPKQFKAEDVLPPLPRSTINQISSSDLADFIKKKIHGQDSVIEKVAKAVTVAFLKQGDSRKPTSIMLVGPSGTGKTEIAKQVSDYINGKFFVFNMNQFQTAEDIWSFFGPAMGYAGHAKGGMLPGAIREANKAGMPLIIVLDEIEKAAPELLQSLLSFIDEGIASDCVTPPGMKEIAPKKTVVFFTSNLIAEECSFMHSNDLREAVKKTKPRSLSPELANRISSYIGFGYAEGVEDKMIEIVLDIIRKEFGLKIQITSAAVDYYKPIVGAEMKRSGVRGLVPMFEGLLVESIEEALRTNKSVLIDIVNNQPQAKLV